MLDRGAEDLLSDIVERCRTEVPSRGAAVERLDLVTLEVELARSGRSDGKRIGPSLREARGVFSEGPINPWIYGGLAHVGLVSLEVGELFGRAVGGLSTVDSSIRNLLTQFGDGMHCDLLQGCLGLGLYGLAHPDRDVGIEFVERVVSLVRNGGQSDANGSFHRMPASSLLEAGRPEMVGWRDLGLAHGNAGIVSFLSRVYAEMPELQVADLLQRHAEWLCAQAGSDPTSSIYSNHAETPYQESRLGWCYGDLGCWLALDAVAKAAPELCPSALEVVLLIETSIQTRAVEEYGISDACLCHGEAGLIQVARRMSFDSSGIVDAALARLMASPFPFTYDAPGGFRENLSLLEGDVGVALSLLETIDGHAGPWSERFLLGRG